MAALIGAAWGQQVRVEQSGDGWAVTGTHFRANVDANGILDLRAGDIHLPHVGALAWEGNTWGNRQGEWSPQEVAVHPDPGQSADEATITLSGPWQVGGVEGQLDCELRFSNTGDGQVSVSWRVTLPGASSQRLCSRVEVAADPGLEFAREADGSGRFEPKHPTSVPAYTLCSQRGNRLRVEPTGAAMIHTHAPDGGSANTYLWFAHDGIPAGVTEGAVDLTLELTDEDRLGRAIQVLNQAKWEIAPADDLAFPPADGYVALPSVPWAADSWRQLKVGVETPCAWYRHRFHVPAHWSERSLRLHFEAVFLVSHVYINGVRIAENEEGFLPFEVDVSGTLRPGEENELVVGVIGDAAKAPPGLVLASQHRYMSGIWQPVSLVATPKTHIEDVFVRPSVRNGTLSVDVTVRNELRDGATPRVSARVLDGEAVALKLDPVDVPVAGSGSAMVTLASRWETPKLWSPAAPNMYTLEVTQDSPRDTVRVPFGFREVWLDGPRIMLNGSPVRLRSTWGHKGEWHYTAPDRVFQVLKDHNLNCARIHGQPIRREYYDAADREGFLLIAESAVYQRPVSDQALEHSRRFIRALRNHPSIVVWSGTNEFGHWKTPRDQQRTDWLVAQREMIRELDPTRPVQQSGYGETDGREMLLNIHYPEMNPADAPACFRWPTSASVPMAENYLNFEWSRDKPLAIGEHLLLGHDWASAMLGDAVYSREPTEQAEAVIRGQADLFDMAVQEYRRQGLCMISPMVFRSLPKGKELPNPYLERFRDIFAPVTAYLAEYDRHWFGGSRVERTALICNETDRAMSGELRWAVTVQGCVSESGSVPADVPAGAIAEARFSFTAPSVNAPTDGEIQLAWEFGDKRVTRKLPVQFWPRIDLPAPATDCLLFDPTGRLAALLAEEGVSVRRIAALSALPESGARQLIVGPDALHEAQQGDAAIVGDWVRQGNTVVTLEQSSLPDRFFPVPLETRGPASIAFLRAPGHPLLANLSDFALRFWTPDARVCETNLAKPIRGGFVPLVDVGGQGMEQSPMVELRHGSGRYVVCQLLVGRYAQTVPAARQILANILAWQPEPTPLRTLAGWSATPSALAQSVQWDVQARASWKREAELPEPGGLVLIEATRLAREDTPALRAFARAGGTVLIHGSGPDNAPALADLLARKIRFQPAQPGPVSVTAAPLTRGIGSYDLWWADPEGAYEDSALRWTPAFDDYSGVRLLTEPAGLVEVSLGKGRVILSQFRWERVPACSRALRYASMLLSNLDVDIPGQSLVAHETGEWFAVDLAPFCNRGLVDEVAGDGRGGWADGGEDDLRNLPTGPQVLAGLPFDIIRPELNAGRSCIMLDGVLLGEAGETRSGTAGISAVRQIPVGRSVETLGFLHAAVPTPGIDPVGAEVGAYVVQYGDGSQARIPVRIGAELLPWSAESPGDVQDGALAWSGLNGRGELVSLYSLTWRNPHPELTVDSLDVETAGNPGYSLGVVAITGRESIVR